MQCFVEHLMTEYFPTESDHVRAEIAALAARFIAEDGADYGTAKKKAVKQILGNRKYRADILPNNTQIEEEVRLYNDLFLADTQPARLRYLRELALHLMEDMEQFSPYLTGAVLNGTAGEHSDIYIQLFTSSAKDVEIFLLNKNIQYEVTENTNSNNHRVTSEILSFLIHPKHQQPEGVHLMVYDTDDLRNHRKISSGNRADRDAVRKLLMEVNT